MKNYWIAGLLLMPMLMHAQIKQLSFFQIPPQEIKLLLTEKKYEFDVYSLSDPIKVLPNTAYRYGNNFDKSLPKGYYILSSLNGLTERFYYYHHTDFGAIKLKALDGERYLYIPNQQFPSDSLQVIVDDEPLPYLAELGLFRLGERSKSGVLSISSPKETVHMAYESSTEKVILLSEINALDESVSYSEHRSRKKEWKGPLGFGLKKWYLTAETQGYLALNQPIYRPGDSLKLKAYILNADSKGLTQSLSLKIHPSGYPQEAKLWSALSPSSAGVYLFTTQLADSLQLDRNYTLILQNAEGQTLVQNYFKLEDYLLDEFSFSFFKEPGYDLLTDTSSFIFKARTENDLPVPGVRVFLEVDLYQINQAAKTPIYVPFQLIDTIIALPPNGFYRLALPPSQFPSIKSDYYLKARFVGSNGEQSTQTLYLTRYDSIPKNTTKKYPFQGNPLPSLQYQGWQKTDSANFKIYNPKGEAYLYRIYRQHELITEGVSQDSLSWQWAQEGEAFWRMEIQDLVGSDTRKLNLAPSQHLLNIHFQQPDTIKPGQKVQATIKVTDSQGKPVPNTDLTVWGVNAQFPTENVPPLPYLGPQILSQSTQSSIETSASFRNNFNEKRSLSPNRTEQLGLFSKDYYQLYFPDSLVLKYYPIADTSVAMYAPFVFDSLGRQQKVHFIWQDSVIKYYAEANPEHPYCIVSKSSGEITLDLRLKEDLVHLPHILLKKGYKLELSLNRDRLPKGATQEIRPSRMTLEEADIVNQYFPTFNSRLGEITYLWQKDWQYPIRVAANYQFRAGPFSQDSIYVLNPGLFGRKIDWTAGYQYKVKKWEVIINQAEPAKVGKHFYAALLNQKPGQSIQTLDSLDFTILQFDNQDGIPDIYDSEPFFPYQEFRKAGIKIFHSIVEQKRPLHFVLEISHDSLNRYVKSATSKATSWELPPDTYRLQAHFPDSLCVQYEDIEIKADSIWVVDLAQLVGDTLSKDQWKSEKDISPNIAYHQPWQEDLELNYSRNYLGQHRLKFRIVDAFGEAVAGVKVWTKEDRNSRRLQISDEHGRVEFTHMNDPSPQMSFYHPDYRYAKQKYEGESEVQLQSMPEVHLPKWQAALNAPHQVDRYYYSSKRFVVSFLDAPPAYIPIPELFYQDTLNPVLQKFYLDSAMLPIVPKLAEAKVVEGGFPDFEFPPVGLQWGINSTWGLAKMQGTLTYEKGGFGDLGLWFQLQKRLQAHLSVGIESQYASAQRGPAIIQPNSLWEDWYEAGAAVYPAIRRDRWSSALQLKYALIQQPKWEAYLGLGAGIMGGRVALDASRAGQFYDYQEIFALDQSATPLRNQDRTDRLRGIRDEEYETIYALQKQIAPYALSSAQISYRLAPRLQVYANYQIQRSGRNTWDTEVGSYDPLSQGPTGILNRRWHQQIGIGLNLRLSRGVQSLWWQNPVSGIYSDVADTRALVNSLTLDSDGDGVPDLYDKEPGYLFSSPGRSVDANGRALDSDRDGIPDLYDKEPNSPEGMYYDAKGVSIVMPAFDYMQNASDSLVSLNEELEESLRQDFRDAAFWEPTLRTDANGEVKFSIQYPDDITAWHCYVLAMNENRQSGYHKDTVKAQAPLLARLDLPQSLRVGDQLDVVGRVQSLADTSQQIYTRFLLGDSLFEERSVLLEEYWTETRHFSPSDTGTLQIAYVLRDSSGFTEGELRELEVIDNRTPETIGSFVYLEGDSSISMPSGFAASQNVHLIAYSQEIDFLRERMDWLYRYPHGCNEQLASRLIGLHLQQWVETDASKLASLKQRQRQIVRKLKRSQNPNGSWGWWGGNSGEEWMSLYVVKALQLASPNEKEITTGQNWLVQAFREAVRKDQKPSLKLVHYLLQNQLIDKTDFELPKLDTLQKQASIYDRLLHLAIRQQQGDSISVAQIIGLSQRDILGGRYWSERAWRWYGSQIECTALAYELIKEIDDDHQALGQIRQFLLTAEHAWQNHTIETARMLQVLIQAQDLANYQQMKASPKLQLMYEGQSKLYDSFPLELSVPPKEVKIRKQGGSPLLLSFSQTQWLRDPVAVDSLFKIRSSLVQAGQAMDSLIKGEKVDLVVEIEILYKADHLMLEVPIPSGCTYSAKPQPYGEAYREYRRDRTNIYVRSLKPGKYVYRIPLESRFTGEFQLLPSRMELMYVPSEFGRNETRTIKISN